MSWKACAYVKELRDGLIITEKFVLLILAEYHRTDDRLAWPSVETLAEDCLMTERGVYQILSRLEEKDFIRRTKGGGRGLKTGYQIVGVDVKKDELGTVNGKTVHTDSVNETLNREALNPERNPAQPTYRNKEEPVLEPVKESNRLVADDFQTQSLDGQVCEIASLYPKIDDAFHLSQEVAQVICEAIARDGRDAVWIGTKSMAEKVQDWPKSDQQFIPSAARYFRESQYRKDPEFWNRSNGNAKQPTTSASTARQQRVREGLVRAAVRFTAERDGPVRG